MSTLGKPTTLGGTPKQATTLGGAPAKGSSLGAPAASGTSLGASASPSAPPPSTTLGATTLGTAPTAASTSSAAAKKKKKDAAKKKAAEGGQPESEPTIEASETVKQSEPAENSGTEAAPANTAAAAAAAAAAPPPAKKGAAPAPAKKKGPASALAARILKEKEERERKEREEQERIKKEEEEELRRIEEQKKLDLERQAQAEVRKALRKKEEEERKKREAAAKRAAVLARFGGSIVAPQAIANATSSAPAPVADASAEAASNAEGSPDAAPKKRPVYKDKKKQQKQQASSATQAEGSNADGSALSGAAVDSEAAPADSWEEVAADESSLHSATASASSVVSGGSGSPAQDTKQPQTAASETSVASPTPAAAEAVVENKPDDQPAAVPAEADSHKLRSPICCVLGHVDTGKTKLLDKMRNTSVQEGEVGGITQQIGATYFPMETIRDITQKLNQRYRLEYKVPGLLVIDTPGHASFSNLRSRGSSLCDIAVLVVDLMHGLEPQTLESINLLKMRNTPFVVALNKVDRLYQWRAFKSSPIQESLKKQDQHVLLEYEERVAQVITQFAEQGLNATLYYKAKKLQDFAKNISLVPTSAITGEGIPDLLLLLVQLTQKMMSDRLEEHSGLRCTVLEVKVIEGFGATIDVILASGTLREGDEILICGLHGPIRTRIRSLLTPPPLRELRIKAQYVHHKEVHAAQGVKIAAQNLDDAIAGSQLFVLSPDSDVAALEKQVMAQLDSLREKVSKAKTGVYVQASTLGSLEALLDFLGKDCKIPVAGIGIGPVHKRDVMIASVMMERSPEHACILAFDVKVAVDAREMADKLKVRIFEADIIYHLEDMFKKYVDEIAESKRSKAKNEAVFPVTLQILPEHIFRQRDPIVVGVRIKEGILKLGTPLCVIKPEGPLEIGKVSGIEREHKQVEEAKAGDEVAVSIAQDDGQQKFLYGRQFDHTDDLLSKINRTSLDALKEHFPEICTQPPIFKLLKRFKTIYDF